ncbi:cytochrome P450 [Lentzea sp. NPDC051213]|uniref:cytochrome P450 n=1 Tax=Lentzea sp. NPDC051213 TaxID=3364126 RepID=UPI00378A1A72
MQQTWYDHPVWIITDPGLARTVLSDGRFAKDPALAPKHWDTRTAGLEPTAAEQMSVTTLDGEPHTRLRKAFAPLFSAAKMRAFYPRMQAIAAKLLNQLPNEVDLIDDFTTRYPLAVLCELLGIPEHHVGTAMDACRLMHVDYPANVPAAMAGFARLATEATAELRMPDGSTEQDRDYQIFTILFAGQLTTDLAAGFLIARILSDANESADELVRETLREHPPAPFTLWRFTTTDVEIAGTHLPQGSPVLVDLTSTPDLVFGYGPHFCIGAQLAQLELKALAETFRTGYPNATATAPLTHSSPGGIMGSRLHALPVRLA